jgi:hypothetical protein
MFQGGNKQVIFSNPASTEALMSSTHKLEKCAKITIFKPVKAYDDDEQTTDTQVLSAQP